MATPQKIDFFKQLKTDYKQAKKPIFIDTTPGQYLAVDGAGAPGGDCFAEAICALYSMAFTIKMTRKAVGLGDYVVCKLEAVYDCEDYNFTQTPPDQWRWTMMIRTPDCVNDKDLQQAVEALTTKGKALGFEKVRLIKLDEGKAVQLLHVGPYQEEGRSYDIMQEFVEVNNLLVAGKSHDIYISDARRVAPENLKTILRLPVK